MRVRRVVEAGWEKTGVAEESIGGKDRCDRQKRDGGKDWCGNAHWSVREIFAPRVQSCRMGCVAGRNRSTTTGDWFHHAEKVLPADARVAAPL